MARQVQVADVMLEGESIRYGTALYRVNHIVEDQPLDQEFAEFLIGDIRDVLRVCDAKAFKDIRDKVSGKPHGASISLPVAETRKIVAAALRPPKNETSAV